MKQLNSKCPERPSVADWGDDVSAGCITGPIVHLKGHYGWPHNVLYYH